MVAVSSPWGRSMRQRDHSTLDCRVGVAQKHVNVALDSCGDPDTRRAWYFVALAESVVRVVVVTPRPTHKLRPTYRFDPLAKYLIRKLGSQRLMIRRQNPSVRPAYVVVTGGRVPEKPFSGLSTVDCVKTCRYGDRSNMGSSGSERVSMYASRLSKASQVEFARAGRKTSEGRRDRCRCASPVTGRR